ncbi:hypothetical protein V5738_17160 [Salinisphaera sp. SPP-AMP-43]
MVVFSTVLRAQTRKTDVLGSFLSEALAFLHGQPIDARDHSPF